MKMFLQSVLLLSSSTRKREIRENAHSSTEYIVMHGIVQF